MKIIIETIPHNSQRYPTVGDYIIDNNGDINIYVSAMENWRYEMLVAVHELNEVLLAKHNEIPEEVITAFDEAFEKIRKNNPEIIGDQEPGNMVSAPYHKEHVFATKVEKLLATALGVNWEEYDKSVNEL